MNEFINKFLDQATDFLAEKPGLLPLIGVLLIILNFIISLIFSSTDHVLVTSNPLLHLGLILGLIGILAIKPLG